MTAFVRATTKYWVRSEDLSAVKLEIGKHLPVLLCGGKGEGIMPDSQLVNSVYLDSPALELYHGRLNKTPGAVALRLRWYGMAVADGAAGTAAERSRAWVVAVALSVGSIAINIFALYNYKWRLGRIRSREPVEWGDPRGPAVLGSILIALLSLSLVLNTRRLMAGEI